MLHTHLYLHVAPTRRESGRRLRAFQKSNALSEMGERWAEKYLVFKGLKKEGGMVVTGTIGSRTDDQWRALLNAILDAWVP
jgi:hypothetical protein